MEHITVGRAYNKGKVAFVECVRNGSLEDISIKGRYFLLVILTKGRLEFTVGGKELSATAPAFLCFDETEDPFFPRHSAAEYMCIYFHPKYLNVNMCFGLLRSGDYKDIATAHDMFMLRPFIDKAYTVPICETQAEKIETLAECMLKELAEQRDWYWSCRGRSYFMEIIIALERMYGLLGYDPENTKKDGAERIFDPKLRDAVLYIESHYGEPLTLSKISECAGVNRTTLTTLMKAELGSTVMEYLMRHRIAVAKKQLAFTEVPIKDIAGMVGFKTVQHFTRTFKEQLGTTPAEFRKNAVEKRKNRFS